MISPSIIIHIISNDPKYITTTIKIYMLRMAYHKVFKPLALSYKPRNTISNWKIPSF